MVYLRVFHPSAREWIKRGFRDYCGVYVAYALLTISTAKFMWEYRNGIHVTRYKNAYTVFRQHDPVSRMYPKEFITDKHLLSDDHPTTLEECDDMPKGKPIFEGVLYQKLGTTLR